jgi:hypothetical protein
MFLQDDWKVTPNFTLNLGLRWEYNSPFTEGPKHEDQAVFDRASQQIVIAGKTGPQTFRHPVNRDEIVVIPGGADFGIPRGLYHKDWNNFGPRFGFAWSPDAGNLVIRGGYGLSTTPEIPNPHYQFRNATFPWLVAQTFIADAASPNISLSDPFPDALARTSFTARAIDQNWRNGYMQQWTMSVQKPIGGNSVLDMAYSGSKGTKLNSSENINQPVLGSGSVDSRRPIQGWGNITQSGRGQASNYHSLQAKFERRFSQGLTFVSAYTWAHSIDDNGSQDAYNRWADRGNSNWDYRHRLVNSYSYQLPVGRGRRFLPDISGFASVLLSGWQVAGITTMQTGQSFSPTVSGDIRVHDVETGPVVELCVLEAQGRVEFAMGAGGIVEDLGQCAQHVVVIVEDLVVVSRFALVSADENRVRCVDHDLPHVVVGQERGEGAVPGQVAKGALGDEGRIGDVVGTQASLVFVGEDLELGVDEGAELGIAARCGGVEGAVLGPFLDPSLELDERRDVAVVLDGRRGHRPSVRFGVAAGAGMGGRP